MKTKFHHSFVVLALLALLSTILYQPFTLRAQGTAFTYQGQLQNNGGPASGTYNLTFSLFNTSIAGSAIAGPVTNNAVNVTNGLFTVFIDFGSGLFTGTSNWLEIGVETNGFGAFTTLSPRQQLTPAPYAIDAESAEQFERHLVGFSIDQHWQYEWQWKLLRRAIRQFDDQRQLQHSHRPGRAYQQHERQL